ncbi:hypothetical protein Tcan_01783, partial [Toxocara canis]
LICITSTRQLTLIAYSLHVRATIYCRSKYNRNTSSIHVRHTRAQLSDRFCVIRSIHANGLYTYFFVTICVRFVALIPSFKMLHFIIRIQTVPSYFDHICMFVHIVHRKKRCFGKAFPAHRTSHVNRISLPLVSQCPGEGTFVELDAKLSSTITAR